MQGRTEGRAAALRAWLIGAPMEAISMLLGQDAEALIRTELLALAQMEGGSAEASAQRRKRNGRPAGRQVVVKQKQPKAHAERESGPGQASAPDDNHQRKAHARRLKEAWERQATWRDTIRTALMALGPATVDEILEHLRECGIERPRGAVTTTLHQLKDTGEVEKRGEQWLLNRT